MVALDHGTPEAGLDARKGKRANPDDRSGRDAGLETMTPEERSARAKKASMAAAAKRTAERREDAAFAGGDGGSELPALAGR